MEKGRGLRQGLDGQDGRDRQEGRDGQERREGWIPFSGGELEAPRPLVRCAACRRKAGGPGGDATRPVLCFACHQADRARQAALKAAGQVDTGSITRFQAQLPFEPVNRARLEQLRAVRVAAQTAARHGAGRFEHRRRTAQIEARRALQQIVSGVRARGAATPEERRAFASAVHAAELQLPDSWLPFVVSR